MRAFRFAGAVLLIAFCVTPSKAVDGVYKEYRAREQTWMIGNPLIQAAFQLMPDGRFRYRWLYDAAARRLWRSSDYDSGSPVNLTVDGFSFASATKYSLSSFSLDDIDSPAPGVRFSIALESDGAPGTIRFEAEVYEGQPFVRYRTAYTNTGSSAEVITQTNMLAWTFQDAGQTFRDFFVGQWKWGRAENFEPHETNLSQQDGPAEMFTGAYGDHTAWRALRDSRDNGLIAAWEFDGRAFALAEHVQDRG